jgi:hypothetical protein
MEGSRIHPVGSVVVVVVVVFTFFLFAAAPRSQSRYCTAGLLPT